MKKADVSTPTISSKTRERRTLMSEDSRQCNFFFQVCISFGTGLCGIPAEKEQTERKEFCKSFSSKGKN